jgi:hypothetical protein
MPCCKFQFIVLFGFEICRTFGATAAAGRLGFSRGEAGTEIGSSEPISVTDVECGQKC